MKKEIIIFVNSKGETEIKAVGMSTYELIGILEAAKNQIIKNALKSIEHKP